MEEFLKQVTLYLAHGAELCGAFVIAVATVRGLVTYVIALLTDHTGLVPKEAIRLNLGRSLALALEFELGADILKTAVAPTWTEIGQLGAIIILRTALNYFLEQELERAASHPQEAAQISREAAEPASQRS